MHQNRACSELSALELVRAQRSQRAAQAQLKLRTGAAQRITEGVNICRVGAVLGHAAPSTTLNTYSNAVANAQAAAVAKIDERLEQFTFRAISL